MKRERTAGEEMGPASWARRGARAAGALLAALALTLAWLGLARSLAAAEAGQPELYFLDGQEELVVSLTGEEEIEIHLEAANPTTQTLTAAVQLQVLGFVAPSGQITPTGELVAGLEAPDGGMPSEPGAGGLAATGVFTLPAGRTTNLAFILRPQPGGESRAGAFRGTLAASLNGGAPVRQKLTLRYGPRADATILSPEVSVQALGCPRAIAYLDPRFSPALDALVNPRSRLAGMLEFFLLTRPDRAGARQWALENRGNSRWLEGIFCPRTYPDGNPNMINNSHAIRLENAGAAEANRAGGSAVSKDGQGQVSVGLRYVADCQDPECTGFFLTLNGSYRSGRYEGKLYLDRTNPASSPNTAVTVLLRDERRLPLAALLAGILVSGLISRFFGSVLPGRKEAWKRRDFHREALRLRREGDLLQKRVEWTDWSSNPDLKRSLLEKLEGIDRELALAEAEADLKGARKQVIEVQQALGEEAPLPRPRRAPLEGPAAPAARLKEISLEIEGQPADVPFPPQATEGRLLALVVIVTFYEPAPTGTCANLEISFGDGTRLSLPNVTVEPGCSSRKLDFSYIYLKPGIYPVTAQAQGNLFALGRLEVAPETTASGRLLAWWGKAGEWTRDSWTTWQRKTRVNRLWWLRRLADRVIESVLFFIDWAAHNFLNLLRWAVIILTGYSLVYLSNPTFGSERDYALALLWAPTTEIVLKGVDAVLSGDLGAALGGLLKK